MEGVMRAQGEEVDFSRLPGSSTSREEQPVAISMTLPSRLPRRLEDFPLPNNSPFPYGRIDAGVESNLGLLAEAAVPQEMDDGRRDPEVAPCSTPIQDPSVPCPYNKNWIAKLPSEVISHILTFVDPTDLTRVARTGRHFSKHARDDNIWREMVQKHVPGATITRSWPCATYKDLFTSLDPHWFLPKYKIWFADSFLSGKLILVRYDPRRGSIEGYQLVAERCLIKPQSWDEQDDVMIHGFCPHVHLHLDQPVLHIPSTPLPAHTSTLRRAQVNMPNLETTPGVYSILSLARTVNPYPGMQTWPSKDIPVYPWHRVRNVSHDGFRGAGHRPDRRGDICDRAFRIRRGIQMPGPPGALGIQMAGEDVHTYSTLDPRLYTPTAEKPWRGIFVGDYSGHGCEFLLMHQPDMEDVYVPKRIGENDEAFEERQKHEQIYRGSIRAIKLTGDPNVPRGETTFVAPDIGDAGCLPPGEAPPFEGARIVRSQGQAAMRGFTDPKWIDTQLIMVSHDILAQFWEPFGHISYFQRVDIDQLLVPGSNPQPVHHLRAPTSPSGDEDEVEGDMDEEEAEEP